MAKPLSLNDKRFDLIKNKVGLVYKTSKGLKVYSFDNRPAGRPISTVELTKGLTVSEAIIKAQKELDSKAVTN